jgi:hypothetical protein
VFRASSIVVKRVVESALQCNEAPSALSCNQLFLSLSTTLFLPTNLTSMHRHLCSSSNSIKIHHCKNRYPAGFRNVKPKSPYLPRTLQTEVVRVLGPLSCPAAPSEAKWHRRHADMLACWHAGMQTCRHADMQTCPIVLYGHDMLWIALLQPTRSRMHLNIFRGCLICNVHN